MMCVGQSDKNKKAPLAASDRPDSINLMSGASLEAELQKTVDVNNAKVGDEIMLKVTKSIKQSGEVVIPKGSTRMGRVTEVQRKTKQNPQSRLGMVFDRIQGKNLSAPFSASVVSITNAAANVGPGESLISSDVSGSSQTSGSASGGGLLGGVGSTVGGLVNTTTQTAGTVTNTAAQTAATATGTVGRTINGIHISNSANASADTSTTLSSLNKNVRVEKGATFNLRVSNQADRQE